MAAIFDFKFSPKMHKYNNACISLAIQDSDCIEMVYPQGI